MTFQEPYLTETVVFGMHRYRSPGEDSSVYFVDEARGLRKMLVDSRGRIQNFPGVVKEAFWAREVSPDAMKPQIHFRTSFEKRRNCWIMLWQIQPDGRYWADDDGYGWGKEVEVTLYTYVDQNGDFTGPFQIYEVGSRSYTLDRYEAALEYLYPKYFARLEAGDLHTSYNQHPEDLLFPRLNGTPYSHDRRELYDLRSKEEALSYWNYPVLSGNLRDATQILLGIGKTIDEITDQYYQRCIQASMTLFYLLTGETVFKAVLDKFFNGALDSKTENILL